MRCIISLITQFFVVYSLVFIVQSLNQLGIIPGDGEQSSLVMVTETVFFAPMLCILFLAARMRAVQLTHGQAEKYDLPQWWLKAGMVTCTWAVLALTILAFLCTVLYGDRYEKARSQSLGCTGRFLFAGRSLTMCIIYVSFTVVCIGICIMQAPPDLWIEEGGAPESPAVFCTAFLSVIYFAVYLALACTRASEDAGLLGSPQRVRPAHKLLKTATVTVASAPMLCVLFIAVRLRATQLQRWQGDPQYWVQISFYFCTFSVFVQTLLAATGATLGGQDTLDVKEYPDGTRESSARTQTMETVRLAAVACLYIGVAVVMFGMFTMEPQDGRLSVPLPSVLRSVLILTALYFAVYFAFWVVLTAQRLRSDGPSSSSSSAAGGPAIFGGFEREPDQFSAFRLFLERRARQAVRFCPILCILFLATMMRATQTTGTIGEISLDGWCEDFQRLATLCIILLTFARIDTAFVPKAPPLVTSLCTAFQYLCLIVLYASAIGVVVALVTMPPGYSHGFSSMETSFLSGSVVLR
jgi:hypothetical protein